MRKHGISFNLAQRAFDDPDAVSHRDRFEGGEYRWQTVGVMDGTIFLLVAYAAQNDSEQEVIRIISARTSQQERKKMV